MGRISKDKQTATDAVLSLKDRIETEWKDLTHDEIRIKLFQATGIEITRIHLGCIIRENNIKISPRSNAKWNDFRMRSKRYGGQA